MYVKLLQMIALCINWFGFNLENLKDVPLCQTLRESLRQQRPGRCNLFANNPLLIGGFVNIIYKYI